MVRLIETFPTPDALADAAAEGIENRLAEALAARGQASLVGTGGRSPGAVYDRLAIAPLAWERVTVTLCDERCVADTSAESNARLVRGRLLQDGAIPARFLALWPAPEPCALAELTPFDVVMLGMGEDGHIASLLPGDPGLAEALTTPDLLRRVPAGLGKPPLARITLTLSALTASRAIFLLISGATKRGVIERAMHGDDLPVSRLIAVAEPPVRILWSPEA